MSKIANRIAPTSQTKTPAAQQQKSKKAPNEPRLSTGSKHDQILALLRRKHGASLEEMQKASGWQSHSMRGFLSGTVKKRLGLKLQSSKSKDGERRYKTAG